MAPVEEAANLLQAGAKAHKNGDLKAAEELYEQALAEKDKSETGAEVAELLHLLGALRIQKLGVDDDDEGPQKPPTAELEAGVALLRRAAAALPSSAEDSARARLLCSLGTALLRPGAPEAMLREGLQLLRVALRLDATRWAAWYNVARALALLAAEREKACGEDTSEIQALNEEKVSALRSARRLKPRHSGCLYRLGMSLREAGQQEEAGEALDEFLQVARNDHSRCGKRRSAGAQHWLAVLRKETTATAPAEYVAGLFDCYAERFDEHLVGALEYRTPELLEEELKQAKSSLQLDFGFCVDLGCGTGLMGPRLRKLGVEKLEGVDLSRNMLQVAEEKQRGYDRLVCGDLLELLSQELDLVVAADVFVYLGDLQPVLAACGRCLRPRGLAAFSTEAPPRRGSANEEEGPVPENGFKLAETGRYLHRASYVTQTAEGCGLKLWKRCNVVLRKNGGKPVHGHLHLFLKPGP
ncbi:unnamed protein product [Effrenium voratum]|uniref:Methyltransferase type 11 domain-containing protein n=1 Tax=Effrenium voratum TaxID=2562239 RepID=A0AA36MW75_9DINO|nr:unnamed protein product [Effrenium voratum]CAJ1420934.1 unnamed protein product [Effrenium voratum]